MPKANSTLDEELYAGLQTARKGKPLNFCLITDGPNVCKLIVQKKKISDGVAAKAKSESGGKAITMGVVVGQGADLAFEVLDVEPSTKPQKIREFIDEQTEISCKPRWAVVTAMRVIDEDGAATTTTEPPKEPTKETPPTTEGDGQAKTTSPDGDGKTTPTPEPDFAIKARQSLVPREKTIKAGLEWASKSKSSHEAAVTEAYEVAKDKLAKAKTEEEFEGAVQAHDDVIALIRKATQEANPTKPSVPVETSKYFIYALSNAENELKQLQTQPLANPAEVQRCQGMLRSLESHREAKDLEQATLILGELSKAVAAEAKLAKQKLQDYVKDLKSHPDSKYIDRTFQDITDWRGFDHEQKEAGLRALKAYHAFNDAKGDPTKVIDLRDKAKLACEGWDKEVARVAKAKEEFDKLFDPDREVIKAAGGLLRKKGLPKPIETILGKLKKPYDDFTYHHQHDLYEEATKELAEVAKLAQEAVDAEKNLREAKKRFNEADKAIHGSVLEAHKFVLELETKKLNVGPVKNICDDLKAAFQLVDIELQELRYDDAIPLLGGLKSASDEVLKFKTTYDQAEQTITDEWNKIQPDYEYAEKMPDANPTAIADKQTMTDAYKLLNDLYVAGDYVAGEKELDAVRRAVAKVKAAHEQLEREKADFQADWNPIYDDYQAVKNLGERDKKVKPLVDELKRAYQELLDPFQKYDYVTAKTKIPAVKLAIAPLLTERPKQEADWNKALKKVESIRKKWFETPDVSDAIKQESAKVEAIWSEANKLADEGGFLAAKAKLPDFVKAYDAFAKLVAANDKIADPKAKQARKNVESLEKKGELKGKSVAEKQSLLADLRGTSVMSKDERKAQRLIYATLDLDDEFLEEDKKKRKVIATELTDSKAKRDELRDFRDNWSGKSLEERLAIVRKALNAQCKALGFGDDPPEIVTYSKPPGKKLTSNGYFKPSDGKIYLNTDPASSLSKDLAKTLDLIFHENSHNYQYKLIARLDPSSPDPLTPGDPEYNQAIMFQMNNGPHSYVKGEEDFDDYKKQPLEDHAHDNGPKTARAVMDGLIVKKKKSTT